MPGPQDLQWTAFSDFSGGLLKRTSDRECPQNGLLEATDCYPQPRGGLRSFARFEPVSHTGLPTNSLIFQLQKLRPPFPQGKLYAAVLALNAEATGIHTFSIYSMDVSTLSAIQTGTWNQDSVHHLVTAIDPSIQLLSYRTAGTAAGITTAGLGYRVYYNLPVAQSTSTASTGTTMYDTQGIFRLGSTVVTDTASSGFMLTVQSSANIGSGASTANPLWPGSMAVHQARLLHTATFDQLHNRVYMTSQGGDTGTTDFFDPIGEKAGSVTWLEPGPAGYLVLAKSERSVMIVQGDMLNPTIREMAITHNYLQSFPVTTDIGTIYMVQDDGVFAFTQGGSQSISPNFYGTPMNPGLYPATFNIANSDSIKLLTPTIAGDFLFMGNGYVRDMRTNAWFQSSYLPASKHHTTDSSFFRVFTAANTVYTGNNVVLNHGYFLENQDTTVTTWNPSSTYSFTLPLIYSPHRQTSVREIVYEVDAFFKGSSLRTQVSVGYKDRDEKVVFDKETDIGGSGPQQVRVGGIGAKGDWVRIRTEMRAPGNHPAPCEAPFVERLFVGTQPATRAERSEPR